MALDIRLTRSSSDEPWGFRLIGGVDFKMPLTVVKVQSSSPAESSGLQNGDTLISINGTPLSSLSHDDAYDVIKCQGNQLSLQIRRGRYDAVLDDQEALYEPVDQLDYFDQPSETEVFRPIDVPDVQVQPLEPTRDSLPPELRSLTASPFVTSEKPYRPFSTEPIPDIPPIEDPIILNPDYCDEFANFDEEFLPKTKFKLPRNEKYDPECGKEKRSKSKSPFCYIDSRCESYSSNFQENVVSTEKCVEEFKEETTKTVVTTEDRTETIVTESKQTFEEVLRRDACVSHEEIVTSGEIEHLKNVNKNIDVVTIEETASSLVEESLNKAVSVAQEINKEIAVELISSEISKLSEESTNKSEICDYNEALSNASSHIKTETISSNQEKELSTVKKEIEEVAAAGIVKKTSATFEHSDEIKSVQSTKIDNQTTAKSQTNINSEKSTTQSVTNGKTTKTMKGDISTSRLLAEQRSYTIGLQTIPKIRGSVHSSYHYNLLLKTFFIHLTDVMVALSRFILTEPALPTDDDKLLKESQTKEETLIQESKNEEQIIQSNETVEKIIQDNKKEISMKAEKTEITENFEIEDTQKIFEKKKLSGSKMAQLIDHKSENLTKVMDAVISEFQNKAGIEETVTLENSSKQSNLFDAVTGETIDPIEWLSRTEHHKETKEVQQIESQSETSYDITEQAKESVRSETEALSEMTVQEISKSKKVRNTYVATVESHVYTNKDAIFEEQFSETSSLQSVDDSNLVDRNEQVISNQERESQISQKISEISSEILKASTTCENTGTMDTSLQEISLSKKEDTLENFGSTQAKFESSVNKSSEAEVAVTGTQSSIFLEATSITESVKENFLASGTETITNVELTQTESNKMVESESATQTQSAMQSSIIQETKIAETASQHQTSIQESSFKTESLDFKETSLTQAREKLSLKLEPRKLSKSDSFPSTISTPTPATVPPTPLTDEYIFRLECPMPKDTGVVIPRSPTPEEEEKDDEDPHIVKKKLVPHIDTKIERIVYDPPLPSPPAEGGNGSGKVVEGDSQIMSSDDILEIERKSSLLASAIDETIKSIEEYKEQVGMDSKRDSLTDPLTPMYNGYVKEAKTTVYTDKMTASEDKAVMEQQWSEVVGQLKLNNENVSKITESSTGVTETVTESFADKIISGEVTKSSDVMQKVDKIEVPQYYQPTDLRLETTSAEKTVDTLNTSLQQTFVKTTESLFASSVKPDILPGFRPVVFKPTNGTYTETENTEKSQNSLETSEKSVVSTTTSTEMVEECTITTEMHNEEIVSEVVPGYRPVPFNPDEIRQNMATRMQYEQQNPSSVDVKVANNIDVSTLNQNITKTYVTPEGDILGTTHGIVDGSVEPVVDPEVVKEIGKPGISDDKIAELISGEAEMLREAHVMGLSRVIASHMTRPDENDSSVDFQKIKPTIEKLKDSEVLKALNEEIVKAKEEKKKKEERTWTTFLQRPQRPVPLVKYGYPAYVTREETAPQECYKVKIVKQPKPKVAPDYKPEDFETGPLPWEERALNEPPPPPVAPEEPILIPEEGPEFLVAVDPLPESEVPDLEDTGITLPPEPVEKLETEEEPKEEEEEQQEVQNEEDVNLDIEKLIEETEQIVLEDMERNQLADQLMTNVQNMVDPNASLEQQLAQMRSQLAALAQLPGVIQQTLELVTKQLINITHHDASKTESQVDAVTEEVSAVENSQQIEETAQTVETVENEEYIETQVNNVEEVTNDAHPLDKPMEDVVNVEDMDRMKKDQEAMLGMQQKLEKQKKEVMDQMQLELESRQVKQHPTPRVGKPKPMFGPLTPQERPLVLPGGRKWRKPKDAYNEQFFTETLAAQAEIIQGKAKGSSYESYILPYDERINFMKYEKPPISLEHLKDSDVYKVIHDMEDGPKRRVDMLTTVVAESDYREKCRSMTPCHP